jgi:hypothetical protein
MPVILPLSFWLCCDVKGPNEDLCFEYKQE